MKTAFTAAAFTLAITVTAAPPLIAALRRLKYGQRAYEDAPATHQRKTGTPTMGGLLFVCVPVVALALRPTGPTAALALLVTGMAAVGAVDDLAAIRKQRNRGLGARAKFAWTAAVGSVFLGWIAPGLAPRPRVLGLGTLPRPVWFALSLATIVATTHAVNLTDGLDGLAGGTILPPLALVGHVADSDAPDAAAFALATAGSVTGFLVYNRHPAKVFMGDTGSLALGAALAGCAILSGTQLLLPVTGGVFAAETVSVILQVASYKTTKKRIFRMSPLHHHFELGGWPETKVTTRFWLASLLLSGLGYALSERA